MENVIVPRNIIVQFIRLNFLASIIPSQKREIKFKSVQLNSREHTRNIVNTRKTTGQPVATIEAVPLDFVEIKISTTKRKVSEEKNESNEKNNKNSQGIFL